jgi:hypothetical protein
MTDTAPKEEEEVLTGSGAPREPGADKPPPEGEVPPEEPEPYPEPLVGHAAGIEQDNVSAEGVQTTRQLNPDGTPASESSVGPVEPSAEQTTRIEAEEVEAEEVVEEAE